MSNTPPNAPFATWIQRGLTAVLAGLALGGAVYWVMQILALGRVDPHVRFVAQPEPEVAQAHWSRLLGAGGSPTVAAEPAQSALTLVAVIARGTQAGRAIISINGQKAQVYRPGDEVQNGRYVVELGPRQVGLGASPQGPVIEVLTLKVPRLP
jgi:hypothetical protein